MWPPGPVLLPHAAKAITSPTGGKAALRCEATGQTGVGTGRRRDVALLDVLHLTARRKQTLSRAERHICLAGRCPWCCRRRRLGPPVRQHFRPLVRPPAGLLACWLPGTEQGARSRTPALQTRPQFHEHPQHTRTCVLAYIAWSTSIYSPLPPARSRSSFFQNFLPHTRITSLL